MYMLCASSVYLNDDARMNVIILCSSTSNVLVHRDLRCLTSKHFWIRASYLILVWPHCLTKHLNPEASQERDRSELLYLVSQLVASALSRQFLWNHPFCSWKI